MTYQFDSRLGEQLFKLLPEVYRTRDRTGRKGRENRADEPLARYLDAHGYLLDLIHATLEQQLRDVLPISSQEWLLPYFAELLAANIVSPDSRGKHEEIAHAVSWRQRKGTLRAAEEIAEAVGQTEVEIQEGWKRVAMTSRIGTPVIAATAMDDTLQLDMHVPSQAAKHPQLPAALVDLRQASRAVEALESNPAARITNFGGVRKSWRQNNHRGSPCFPNSFEDVSRRTVDFRTPGGARGHYHHKRLLMYAPPPTGIFGFEPIRIKWEEREDPLYEHLIYEEVEGGTVVIRNRTHRFIEIIGDVTLSEGVYRIEGIYFQGRLRVEKNGRLQLLDVEANVVDVATFSTDAPVLDATKCLFGTLSVGGLARLDGCTVLDTAFLSTVDARDCIFMNIDGTDITGVIEYSRLPEDAPLSSDRTRMRMKSHPDSRRGGADDQPVTDSPEFMPGQSTLSARAVLSPRAPRAIYEGASDRGEMGYFHGGRQERPVRLADATSAFSLPSEGGYPLADLIFEHDVTVLSGKLVLIRSAVPTMTIDTALSFDAAGAVVPALEARDCIIEELTAGQGLVRMEYCTVMGRTDCKHLQASDCIFVGPILNVEKPRTNKTAPRFVNCVRYSRVPEDLDPAIATALSLVDESDNKTLGTNTEETPIFVNQGYCSDGRHEYRNATFGERGYGVLDLTTPNAIRFGAEDSGEMGACHHKLYSLKSEAVLHKIGEFLPVGIEPLLMYDARLLHQPPETT